jgi:hypothetical protein
VVGHKPLSCYVVENELHLLSSTAMSLKVKCVLYLVYFWIIFINILDEYNFILAVYLLGNG